MHDVEQSVVQQFKCRKTKALMFEIGPVYDAYEKLTILMQSDKEVTRSEKMLIPIRKYSQTRRAIPTTIKTAFREKSIASLFQVKKKHKLRSNRRHKRKAAVVEKTITLNVRPMTMDEEDAAGLQTFIDSRSAEKTRSDQRDAVNDVQNAENINLPEEQRESPEQNIRLPSSPKHEDEIVETAQPVNNSSRSKSHRRKRKAKQQPIFEPTQQTRSNYSPNAPASSHRSRQQQHRSHSFARRRKRYRKKASPKYQHKEK
ncbi:hypothetical protein Tcan_04151 [Toxocara canis]|uniref:Uncharacterized protein n=1 Tax=Toxocara canis TaxID=6265 RepID=A0A0B2VWB1_TOXCA|nr:hypothetical protein Tcan_04151 [Toxocara canis]